VETQPPTTDADRLAEAHAAYQLAEIEFPKAKSALATYSTDRRDDGFKAINGQTYFQINSDPQRLALASTVEHCQFNRDRDNPSYPKMRSVLAFPMTAST
jgi:hypothetical protein